MSARSGLTSEQAADLCLKALADLGGEATAAAVRVQLEAYGTFLSPVYVASLLARLSAREHVPPVFPAGTLPGRGRARLWCLREGGGEGGGALLSWEQTRNVARNARRLREGAGLPLTTAAARAGVPQSSMSLFESAAQRIPVARAEALARVLGTTLEALAADGASRATPPGRLPACPDCGFLGDAAGHFWACAAPGGRPRWRP